jgi:activator of HSP90 ATPase
MEKQLLEFSLSKIFPATPEQIYNSWLAGKLHSAMTGGHADSIAEEGSKFTAWDGYISGKNLTLVPNQKIIQSWRTTEFKNDEEDSIIEIDLKAVERGCQLTLTHSKIPAGQPDYEQGWIEFYFEPMSKYFI